MSKTKYGNKTERNVYKRRSLTAEQVRNMVNPLFEGEIDIPGPLRDRDVDLTRYKEAVWQYLIDHAAVTFDGKYVVKMTIPTRGEFFRKINVRLNGYRVLDYARMENHRSKREEMYKRKLSMRGESRWRYMAMGLISWLMFRLAHLRRKMGPRTYPKAYRRVQRRIVSWPPIPDSP